MSRILPIVILLITACHDGESDSQSAQGKVVAQRDMSAEPVILTFETLGETAQQIRPCSTELARTLVEMAALEGEDVQEQLSTLWAQWPSSKLDDILLRAATKDLLMAIGEQDLEARDQRIDNAIENLEFAAQVVGQGCS